MYTTISTIKFHFCWLEKRAHSNGTSTQTQCNYLSKTYFECHKSTGTIPCSRLFVYSKRREREEWQRRWRAAREQISGGAKVAAITAFVWSFMDLYNRFSWVHCICSFKCALTAIICNFYKDLSLFAMFMTMTTTTAAAKATTKLRFQCSIAHTYHTIYVNFNKFMAKSEWNIRNFVKHTGDVYMSNVHVYSFMLYFGLGII